MQYVIEEVTQAKGKIYLAWLDWFSALNTVDLQLLYLLL